MVVLVYISNNICDGILFLSLFPQNSIAVSRPTLVKLGVCEIAESIYASVVLIL